MQAPRRGCLPPTLGADGPVELQMAALIVELHVDVQGR